MNMNLFINVYVCKNKKNIFFNSLKTVADDKSICINLLVKRIGDSLNKKPLIENF